MTTNHPTTQPPNLSIYRLGFDIGGTFTDFVLRDTQTGALHVHKRLTTPHDPSVAVMEGVRMLLQQAGVSAAEIDMAVHGTTLVGNTLIERSGAKIALLATHGFRDLLEIRNEQRYDIYDLFLQYPEPLVPRSLRLGVHERTDRDGRVLVEPRADELCAIAERLRAANIEALAIAFLHSFRNPHNEQLVARFMAQALPAVHISLSSEVAPEIREYERTSTTVANAYVQPKVRAYIDKLESQLQNEGYRGRLYLMLSSGGNTSARTAAEFPIRLVESGPAAGAMAAAYFGNLIERPNLISFDMGGTTAKICVVDEGKPSLSRGLEVARTQRFRAGSGLPLQFPSVDMIEIGAGGGSIAHLDRLGLLKVGPMSAGADPGPACYGLGGDEPTVTDANLLLGFLNPDYFLGGAMKLDVAAAERALTRIAQPLGLSPVEAAWGIQQLVNEQMAAAAKIHVIEKARDPRRYALLAYGGGGPLHGAGVARILAVPEVICPLAAGVASAVGLLIAPLSFELAQSYPVRWGTADIADVERILSDLQRKGETLLAEAGSLGEVSIERSADGRFVGQLHDLTVPLPSRSLRAEDIEAIAEMFRQRYVQRYGHLPQQVPLEFLSWRVTVSGLRPSLPPTPSLPRFTGEGASAGVRRAYFGPEFGFMEVAVYDRYALAAGASISAPAIVEERESTAILYPGMTARVDAHGNLVINTAAG
jgi:N-methylhydantoinase A/oxoprolinase/acetone carboxylase beta subunit